MDLNTAQSLVSLVNNHKNMIALNEYLDKRIEYHRVELDTASSIEQVKMHQGAIKELKNLKLLYDIVKVKIEEYKNNG